MFNSDKIRVNFRFEEPAFNHGEKFYSCVISNANNFLELPDLIHIEQHITGKSNNDVHLVWLNRCVIEQNLFIIAKYFPNLKALKISDSTIHGIRKSYLAEFPNLIKLDCNSCGLNFLPGDLFENSENIEFISFEGDRLTVIEPNILDGLIKLKHVVFRSRMEYGISKYSYCYSIYSIYQPNVSLAEIKNQLLTKHYSSFPKNIITPQDDLNHQLLKLKSSENKLRDQVEQLKISEAALKLSLQNETLAKSSLAKKIENGIFKELQMFLQEESTKDFKITINDREFKVHKFLLAARSPTLAELLKINPEVENLNLVDISVEIFEKILKFLYTDELPEQEETNFLHLYAAAGKLKIMNLKDFSGKILLDQINEENAMEMLKISNKYEHGELRQKAFAIIKDKYPKIEFSNKWATDHEILLKVIEKFKKKEEAIRKLEEEFEYGIVNE